MNYNSSLAIAVLAGAVAMSAVADFTNVQILATADTDYGSNTVATMVSKVLTAPDGVATYQIAFDVTPPAGRSIRSGITGTAGSSTETSWGVGPEDTTFTGSGSDRVEQIGNLQITNFNANGGAWSLNNFSTLSFSFIEIANGQSGGNDAVQVVVNGGVTNDLGSLSSNPWSIDLEGLALEGVGVTNFVLGTSTTNSANKWSVNHVEVMVLFSRGDWLRGAWGINWKPVDNYNGRSETLAIADFLDQIADLRTIDYIQLHLGESSIKSSVHLGPHDLLESFWQGDTDTNGAIINLVVPRAEIRFDPFLEMLESTKAAGMRSMVYVNSSNMLSRDGPGGSNPGYIPNITERWKAWCDTNTTAQAFIANQPYHTHEWNSSTEQYDTAGPAERKYMFCYAEFVLKVYAIRYGDLIDSWCFDSGSWMPKNGDHATNGKAEDQQIYKAFADACHAGNPIAAISFQNSPERDTEEWNPFSEATRYDDFMFGHPYNGGNDIGSHTIGTPPLYDRNYAHIQKITETDGNVHEGELTHDWTWDDKVIGHFDPPMSTSSWNGGNTPALTDAEFNLWNLEAMQGGGAISWGGPLVSKSGTGTQLNLRDWAMDQLTQMDDHLSVYEDPGMPNWARAYTILPGAAAGQPYYHELTDGVDFWDPAGGSITELILTNHPSWLTAMESSPASGVWVLSGVSTDTAATDYTFELQAMMGATGTARTVQLGVSALETIQTNVQILATANTNYGTDAVAILYSSVQTYGSATFRIAIHVDPMAGTSITSGSAGEWGINAGEGNSGWWTSFDGSLTQSVDSVSNIEIVDFNANGSGLTIADITNRSFKSVVIVDGQHAKDQVKIIAGGVINAAAGVMMGSSPATNDLQALAGSASVSSFTLENGNIGNDKDRWTVGSIWVEYTIEIPSGDGYADWASGYGLVDDDALPDADVENGGIGDGYDNLAEFALGMNPTNSDAGAGESVGTAADGGTNYFEYVHNRRTDYGAQGLSYLLIDSTNLVDAVSNTNSQDQILIGDAVEGYEPVTNRYKADHSVKFIQLRIRQN